MLNKRDFIAAAIALAASSGANAQTAGRDNASPRKIPRGMMKTTRMFKYPQGYGNGLAVAPEGLWIAQQKLSGDGAKRYGLPEPKDLREAAWLVDWNGKLLKTVMTNCRNCSGMAYGDGYVWMMANQAPLGCFQVDMNSKQISHRQIPLAMPGQDGGGSHGAQWHNGKLWIAALRPKLILRVDPKTWVPEVAISTFTTPDKPRTHDLTIDDHGRGKRSVAEAKQPNPLLGVFDLADLDRSRADIDSDQVLSFAHGCAFELSTGAWMSRSQTFAPRPPDSQKTRLSSERVLGPSPRNAGLEPAPAPPAWLVQRRSTYLVSARDSPPGQRRPSAQFGFNYLISFI